MSRATFQPPAGCGWQTVMYRMPDEADLSWVRSRRGPEPAPPQPLGNAGCQRGSVSGTRMTIPVVAQICSTARIIRSEPLHTVSHCVTGRRTIRYRRRIIARTIVARAVRGSQRSAYDCPRDQSSGNRSAPSPSASPLHGLGSVRNRFNDRHRFAHRCGNSAAGEHTDATGEYGRHGNNSK
jgi:hypothetical protein